MSDDKKVKSVNLDQDNAEYLSRQDNASALVDDLVEQYRTNGDRQTAALKLRREQKRRELEDARLTVERLENDLEEIDAMIDDAEDAEENVLDEAAEKLQATELTPDNPAVKKWADKADLSINTFIEELTARRDTVQ